MRTHAFLVGLITVSALFVLLLIIQPEIQPDSPNDSADTFLARGATNQPLTTTTATTTTTTTTTYSSTTDTAHTSQHADTDTTDNTHPSGLWGKIPNLVFILADDLGYGDISPFGARHIVTERLEELASMGKRFTRFYAAAPVCSPTRASVLTGRFPLRFDITGIYGPGNPRHLPVTPTLPMLLQDKYYSTHIGKWHLGGLTPAHVQTRRNSPTGGRPGVAPGPLQHGFSQFIAMEEGSADCFRLQEGLQKSRLYRDGSKHLIRDDTPYTASNEFLTDRQGDEAVAFIEESVEAQRPFFLNLWFDAPHLPLEPAPGHHFSRYNGMPIVFNKIQTYMTQHKISIPKCELLDPINDKCSPIGASEGRAYITECAANENPSQSGIEWDYVPNMPVSPPSPNCVNRLQALYCCLQKTMIGIDGNSRQHDVEYRSMVDNMDANVGKVIDALARLELLENTLIIFTSDNGPEGGTSGSAGPFSGRKRSMLEGGIRVPMIAVWKGHIPAGTETNEIGVTTDILPTFLDLAGIKSPSNLALDGISLRNELTQQAQQHAALNDPMGSTQQRPHNNTLYWGLCTLSPASGQMAALHNGNSKLLVNSAGQPTSLFSLNEDVFEKNNVMNAPLQKQTKEKLAHQLAAYRQEPRLK
eukprot:TRINITY_DN6123_c0_g1_i1.p1 TRINITY_DN6123_c0_g1~~TRINITY_DN6123_c0_g1_i1.p1  ORF type:complete len:643 (-),score=88.17 TRINITY_DN6123_c0_g1_i1:23-1951(-)